MSSLLKDQLRLQLTDVQSIGVALYLQKILGEKSLLLLPVGASDDGPHGPNEKIDRRNYIEGTKLFGAYWHYFAEKA